MQRQRVIYLCDPLGGYRTPIRRVAYGSLRCVLVLNGIAVNYRLTVCIVRPRIPNLTVHTPLRARCAFNGSWPQSLRNHS